jgi:hypothetical protein
VCKGFGPKTAAEYLISQNCRTWQDYCDACARKYEEVHGIGGIKRMIEIFTLVYMCRTEQELTLAKQVASQGGTGLSPTTVAAAEQYMSFMRACN